LVVLPLYNEFNNKRTGKIVGKAMLSIWTIIITIEQK
jgi:hypothetical protein